LESAKSKNFLKSAYVGLRYGAPILRGDGPVGIAPMYGIFSEFRGGILKGVSLSYDFIPGREVADDVVTERYEWSRVQMGYSFGWPLPISFLNWFDIRPQLGVTNLNYEKNNLIDETTVSFSQHRAPTTGVEIGFETRGRSLLLRAWGYGAYSTGILPQDKLFSTRSYRFGLDLYKDLFRLGQIGIGVLGFTAFDSTTIIHKTASDDSENTVKRLDISVFYAGAGVTLSW
jgi:hypothetical protein